MMNNIIGVASDHAGYALKEFVKRRLIELGFSVMDFGTYIQDSCDYADYAHPLATAIEIGECSRGVAVCGSGSGINMTLNKHQGIRAALSWIPEIATLARQHNDANILVLPGRFVSTELADHILSAFLTADFEGGRHAVRINKMPVSKT